MKFDLTRELWEAGMARDIWLVHFNRKYMVRQQKPDTI